MIIIFCRYGFPRFFSNKTMIANPLPPETDEKIKETILKKRKFILKIVKESLEKLEESEEEYDNDMETFLLKNCELYSNEANKKEVEEFKLALNKVGFETDGDIVELYHQAISISEKSRTVILQRKISERNVNNFNATFMSVWQANTDIQVCLDTHAVISYISDYMTKSDQGLTKTLLAALNEKKNASRFEQLNHVKRTYFTHRQTSASEAAYRLIPGLNLKGSNIKTLFLTSGFPENRRTYLRQIPEDEVQSDGIQVEGREGDFQLPTSKVHIYNMRPKDSNSIHSCGQLEKLCFAEFSMKYDRIAIKNVPKQKYGEELIYDEEGKIESGILYEKSEEGKTIQGLPKYFFFCENDKRNYFKLRANPYVLRIYSGKRKDHIEESYSELLLFTSWRNEQETFHNNSEHFREIIREMFRKEDEESDETMDEELLQTITRKGSEVEKNRSKIYPHSNRISELRKLLEDGDYLRKMDTFLDPQTEQQDAEDFEIQDHDDSTNDENPYYEDMPYEKNKTNTLKPEKCVHKIPFLEDTDTMKRAVRKFSFEQRIVFDKYIDFCKRVMCAIRYDGNIDTSPPRIIVHGGGGVGKSYLIKVLSQWVHKILSSWGDISQYPKLTRFAFTGAAAYLIGKLNFQK